MPIKPEDSSYQKVIDLPNQPKEVIFEKSKQWIALTFKSAKAVIEYDSKADGVIIGNGSMPRPVSSINIMGTDTITFTMREDIKDGKVRLTFDRLFALISPSKHTYGGEYPALEADLEGVKANFDMLAENLQKYILNGNSDNW